ncbi:uncharacterized protein [Ptychodera flava]|uniref:uncharacterized protein n=1 Tax=Ptychodera flava TaxID=63121 RepID=UPI003969FF1F
MLKMASAADLIFSMGPKRHDFFQNQYRVCIGKKKLEAIPHKEIPPVPQQSFFEKKLTLGQAIKHNPVLLTYGEIDKDRLVQAFEGLASSFSLVVEASHKFHRDLPGWNILGVPSALREKMSNLLKTKITSDLKVVFPRLFEDLNLDSLDENLCQSHICLPIQYYDEYSFDGLEALALGVPLLIAEYSHLAHFIKKYLPKYCDRYIVRKGEQYPDEIISTLCEIERAFEIAGELKDAFMASEDVTYSFETFVAMFTDDTDSDDNEIVNLNPQIAHREKAAENGQEICKEFYQQESQYEGAQQSDQIEHTQKPVTTRTERVHAPDNQRPRDVMEDSLPGNRKSESAELTVTIRLNEEDFQEAIRNT